jgi:hypothetical protein
MTVYLTDQTDAKQLDEFVIAEEPSRRNSYYGSTYVITIVGQIAYVFSSMEN